MIEIVRVSEKLAAFRADFPAVDYSIIQSFTEDQVDGQPRVVGRCQIVEVETGRVLADSLGTRALRPPIPGTQGAKDTRDPDRAMTQALGRALGTTGYASGDSIEGDTDEPDMTEEPQHAAPPTPPQLAKQIAAGKLVPVGELRAKLNQLDPYWQGVARSKLQKLHVNVQLDDAYPPEIIAEIERVVEEAKTDEILR